MHGLTNAVHGRRAIAAIVCTMGLLSAIGALAQGAPTPITAEPAHKIRFDNGVVRLYEVLLPPGKSTLMHEHAADSFSVMFGTPEMTIEPLGGRPASYQPPTGFVGFTPAPKPYAHRISASGPSPFHVVALELNAGPRGAPQANQRPAALFTVSLENHRGRAYTYTLEPGEATSVFTRAGQTAVIAVSGGRISEAPEGKAARLWDFEPAHFRWVGAAEKLSVKNTGSTKVHLVEIEVF